MAHAGRVAVSRLTWRANNVIASWKKRLPLILAAVLALASDAAVCAESQQIRIRAKTTFASSRLTIFLPDFIPARDPRNGQLPAAPDFIVRNAAGAIVDRGRFAFN